MEKPQKTLGDYLAVAISPVLIMLLVGSLVFFLLEVFYRGEMLHGVRWTLFWFVIAIVLVSRIGIELGKLHARFYGAALAGATWIYLAYTHRVPVLGAVLLAITWWCAHRLTVDCTWIREANAVGAGALPKLWRTLEKQFAPRQPELPPLSALELLAAADVAKRRSKKPPRPPGRSVVWFSLAALPLFGIGQLFLPAGDPQARRAGFALLVLYLAAAFGLLVTTSFLGLRRNLRQHAVEIPASVSTAWIKFGGLLAGGVLLVALILPRPGAMNVWKNLTYLIPHKEHQARNYALPFNSPGKGAGLRTEQPVQRMQPAVDSSRTPPGSGAGTAQKDSPARSTPRGQSDQPGAAGGGGSGGRGSSGQGRGTDDNRPSANPTIPLKDVTPSGNADQPSDNNKQTGGSDVSDGAGHDGAERQTPNVQPAQAHSQPGKDSPRKETQPSKPPVAQTKPVNKPDQPPPPDRNQGQRKPSDFLFRLLHVLLILALAAGLIWLLVRFRKVIADMVRKFLTAVRDFFRKLFRFRRRPPVPVAGSVASTLAPEPFMSYENPFVTGKENIWPREHLLRYTYQAVLAWAKERGIEIKPQQTPREFCSRLIEHFPDVGPELERFSRYCSHAAFAKQLPDDFETESLRRLWEYLGDSVMVLLEPKR
jgi:hypothetical protein